MLRPNYNIQIGSSTIRSGEGHRLVTVRTARGMGIPIDSCEVTLHAKDLRFRIGEQVKVELGYDQELVPVFVGCVDNIEREIEMTTLKALGQTAALLRLRLDRVYMDQTAGSIVRDIAQEGGLKVKEVIGGHQSSMLCCRPWRKRL